MRISDWSSDVCSSDLLTFPLRGRWRGDPIALYRTIRPEAKARFAALIFDGFDWQIGRASCRERVCPYVSLSVVAGSLTQTTPPHHPPHPPPPTPPPPYPPPPPPTPPPPPPTPP